MPPPVPSALPADGVVPQGFNAPAIYTDSDRVAASMEHAAAGLGGVMAGIPGYGAMDSFPGFPGYGYYPGYHGYL
jgi:hypothetical protein